MGAKNARDAKTAKDGAAQFQSSADVPPRDQSPVTECARKHWIAIRVEFENNKLVESGVKMKLKLNNGDTREITLDVGRQADGKYSTNKILDLTDVCEVSFPDLYDAECKLQ